MRIRKQYEGTIDMEAEELELIAQVSDALAHPARLVLFRHIMQCNKAMEPVCTKDLVERFDYAQATISQHMKKLTSSGLVEIRHAEKFSFFYANFGVLMKYIDAARKFSLV